MWLHKTLIHIHVLSLCWCSMSHTLISVPASLLAPGYKLILLQIHHFYVFMFHFQKLKNENITPGSQTSLVGDILYIWSCWWYLSQEQTPIVCLTCCLDSLLTPARMALLCLWPGRNVEMYLWWVTVFYYHQWNSETGVTPDQRGRRNTTLYTTQRPRGSISKWRKF